MLPGCTCAAGGGGRHHHSFGGIYPCEYPEPCSGCRGPEFREPPELPKRDTD